TARIDIVRHRDAADESRAAAQRASEQVTLLGEELSRARGQIAEAIAQRERATLMLRQQISATAGHQHDLAGVRQNPALAALVSRLASIKHRVPRSVKVYIKRRILGIPG